MQNLPLIPLAAFIALFSILTVTTRRTMRAATYLLFVLFGTAGIYFLLGYTFLASVQILVYAGGIVVLYVFSILLTGGEDKFRRRLKRSRRVAALCTTVAGGALLLWIMLTHRFACTAAVEPTEVSMQTLGRELLTTYLLPFEAVSVLLLACMVGSLLIARKR